MAVCASSGAHFPLPSSSQLIRRRCFRWGRVQGPASSGGGPSPLEVLGASKYRSSVRV